MENINLTPGKPYKVKFRGGSKTVTRVYRGEETRFDLIKCFVFTSKVKKGVYAEIDIVKDKDGEPTGVKFWHWKNSSIVPRQDVSIPYYDLQKVEECN